MHSGENLHLLSRSGRILRRFRIRAGKQENFILQSMQSQDEVFARPSIDVSILLANLTLQSGGASWENFEYRIL